MNISTSAFEGAVKSTGAWGLELVVLGKGCALGSRRNRFVPPSAFNCKLELVLGEPAAAKLLAEMAVQCHSINS